MSEDHKDIKLELEITMKGGMDEEAVLCAVTDAVAAYLETCLLGSDTLTNADHLGVSYVSDHDGNEIFCK